MPIKNVYFGEKTSKYFLYIWKYNKNRRKKNSKLLSVCLSLSLYIYIYQVNMDCEYPKNQCSKKKPNSIWNPSEELVEAK